MGYHRFTRAMGLFGKVIAETLRTVPLSITAATLTLSDVHEGRTLLANRAAGITFTLPDASGSGRKFRIVLGTTITSNQLRVNVNGATNYMRGFALGVTDTAGTALAWVTANTGTVSSESDRVDLNGTTQGGRVGDTIELEDIADNVWAVKVFVAGSGTEATPFSAAV
jgi:hypothetical protein